MNKTYSRILLILTIFCTTLIPFIAHAHFQYLIPSTDIVMQNHERSLRIDLRFGHPFEGILMHMKEPIGFSVMVRGRHYDLLKTLKDRDVEGFSTFTALYNVKRPGDHIFYIEPSPYFESAETCFIVHYAKTVVHAFGLEEGWDEEIGLKTEIIPLTRPYGIWTGNTFQGIVKAFEEPVPYAEIEVEYLAGGSLEAPSAPFITQLIKADMNGVFTYAFPKAGWWAFAALSEDRVKLTHTDGKEYPVEIGAVFWIRVWDMP